jgi:F0F1-type ATP synthase gamma subunit
VLRTAIAFIREQEAAGKTIDLYVVGKKGISYFNYQKRRWSPRRSAGHAALRRVERYADAR